MATRKTLTGVGMTALVVVAVVGLLSAGAIANTTSIPAQADVQTSNASETNETIKQVTGTLESTDGEDYQLGDLAIDIGASWYVENTTADADYDNNGSTETIQAEFDGLISEEVTLTVETDGEEGDVLAVNDTQYREEGPPPWAGGPNDNDDDSQSQGPDSEDNDSESQEGGPPPWAGGPNGNGPPN